MINTRNPRFRCAKIPVRIDFLSFPRGHHGEGIAYVNLKISFVRIAPYGILAKQRYIIFIYNVQMHIKKYPNIVFSDL